GSYIGRRLIGKNPRDIEGCTSIMDETIYGNNSIKSAFDIALHDIASRSLGLPLYAFLGGKNNRQIITDYTVSIGDPGAMADEAGKIVNNGFTIIKVKLGKNGKTDIDRVKSIRKKIGNEIPLRLDANQGWSFDEATEVLEEVGACNVQFCEEPLPRWDFMSLPGLTIKSPVPIMADESCSDHHDAERLINIKASHMFNVKLGKSAGLFKAMKICNLAADAGMNVQIGGFLESRLGFTASAHLALASLNARYFDFDTPLMLRDDIIDGGIKYNPGGIITLDDTPGLGASPDMKYLGKLEHVMITE
ncbi:MAG: dipeptide epimerase, partial [Bacteroidales bacterium]